MSQTFALEKRVRDSDHRICPLPHTTVYPPPPLIQQATALKEKEFQLHHSNLMTVGTQAAVLAAVDVTMFIEFQPPVWSSDFDLPHLLPRLIKFFYYCSIVYAFCSNIAVVSHTTVLAVLGTR